MKVTEAQRLAYDAMSRRRDQALREPGWIYYHGQRTGRIALDLARRLNVRVDLDVLYVAGLFHDIGKDDEPHHETGAKLSAEILSDCCTQEELAAVSGLIRTHNQRNGLPEYSKSALLLQDADILDHVGLIGVWLTFYWSGSHSESIDDHLAFIAEGPQEEQRVRMRGLLNFELSRQMYDERVRRENDMFGDFRRIYFDGV